MYALFARTAAVVAALLTTVACDNGASNTAGNTAGSMAPVSLSSAVLPDSQVVQQGDTTFTVYSHSAESYARATPLVLDNTPVMVAGGADGDDEFDLTNVDDVLLLRDGRLAVMLSNEATLLIFKSNGRGQHRWGRRGQGPGEFQMPMAILQGTGDTLLIPDIANGRINVVLPDKGVTTTRAALALSSRLSGGAVGPLAEGEVFVSNFMSVSEVVDDTTTRSLAIVSVLAADSLLQEVLRVPDLDVRRVATRYGGVPSFETEFPYFSRRGHLVALDSVLVTSHDGTISFDVRTAAGALRSRVMVDHARRAVSPELRQYVYDLVLAQFALPSSERMVDRKESERLARERQALDSLPALHDLYASPDQTLWLVDVIMPTDSAWSATAFRQDGRLMGRLTVPGKGRPVAFGNGVVVERVTDADDVVSLVVRRIVTTP